MTGTQKLTETLQKYEINLTKEQLGQFTDFERFLREYNSHTNLLSSKDIELVWQKHFVDSIAFCRYLKDDTPHKIIDIGSGGGFPVIPEAIILTKSNIFALDSTSKKTNFLKQAGDLLKLKNFSVINDRAEDISHRKTFRETFDIVTARAVGNLAQITELSLPFLKTGGYFLAYKSTKVQGEIKSAQNTITLLGGKIEDIYEYELALEENFVRNIILIKKEKQTPVEYPRSFSAIKNKPL